MDTAARMAAVLAPLAGAALTCTACWALGVLLLKRVDTELAPVERLPLAFLLGSAGLHFAIFCVMALHVAYRPVLILLLLATIAAAAIVNKRTVGSGTATNSLSPVLRITFLVIFGAYAVLYFVNAWAPEASPDGSSYHLGLVAHYIQVHGFEPVTTNLYAGLSGGVETLFVPAFAIGRHSAAALVHFAFTVMLAVMIYAYGQHIGKPVVGAAGALLTFLSPVVGIAGSSAYVDVALTAVVFSVFYWLEIWDASRDSRLLVVIGLMAGYGYAVKYTAVAMLLYALGFVAWRTKKIQAVLLVAASASVMMLPWAIKDWIYLDNPIAPFGNALFRNPNMFPLPEKEWLDRLRNYGVENLWTLPLEVTLRGAKTQGVVGAVFLATPLALLALRFRAGRRLLAPAMVLLIVYFTNIGTRFLIPCLPFFSLALALALENAVPVLVLLVMIQMVMSWPPILNRTAARYSWRLRHFPYEGALRLIPEDQFLREQSPAFDLARMAEQYVPPGEPVFLPNDIPESYTSRELVVGHQSSLGRTLNDILEASWIEGRQATQAWLFRFPRHAVRRVRLLQTAALQAPTQWSVHEVRFLNAGAELPRRPEWRLRAFPDPWNVQLAFDNSPVTRWRSWEAASPGMYVDVDFGEEQPIDEVHVETSPDTQGVHMELQAWEQNRWVRLAENPEKRIMTPQGSLGRAAAFEFNARGIHYVLMQDGDYDADAVRDNAEDWGFSVVARSPGGTLYKVGR